MKKLFAQFIVILSLVGCKTISHNVEGNQFISSRYPSAIMTVPNDFLYVGHIEKVKK